MLKLTAVAVAVVTTVGGLVAVQNRAVTEPPAQATSWIVLGGPPEALWPSIAPEAVTAALTAAEPAAAPTAPSTTTVTPRPTIPLAEAVAQGLWGRPRFPGCVSKYGTPSPEWLPDVMREAGWPEEAWPKLCRVIGCESNFRPNARGGLGNRMVGLLQVDEKSWRNRWPQLGYTDMFDPQQNLAFGLWIYQQTRDNEDWNSWPPDQWTCDDA